jgi:predicted TIM-barrel fold metal-dependent hydrolase
MRLPVTAHPPQGLGFHLPQSRPGDDTAMDNVYVDVAANVTEGSAAGDRALIASRVRQLGTRRVLYGSDLGAPGGSIARGWEIFQAKVPLTRSELQQIANNQARFVR